MVSHFTEKKSSVNGPKKEMRTSKELLGLKQSDYKQTVLFCEEKFIRRYDIDQRQVLIDQFDEQINAYCDELGCPFDDDVERFFLIN